MYTWGCPKPSGAPRDSPAQVLGTDWLMAAAHGRFFLLHYAYLPFFLAFLSLCLFLATLLLPCLSPLLTIWSFIYVECVLILLAIKTKVNLCPK